MKKGSIHIGTSGWSYKHWKEIYYPSSVKTTEYLTYYSKEFKIAEINTSFYHLPKAQTIYNWMQKVPPDFLFCPKLSRYITHMKKLRDPEESLMKFFDIFNPMYKQMGPVLIQLPPSLKYNEEVAQIFFSFLRNNFKKYSFVLEVRHETWMVTESLALLKKYNIGFVISQSDNHFPYAEHVTGKNIYLRLHGPAALYASPYSDEQLLSYAKKCMHWRNSGYLVWVFFNNDIHGHAFRDAARLKSLIKNK